MAAVGKLAITESLNNEERCLSIRVILVKFFPHTNSLKSHTFCSSIPVTPCGNDL